MGKTVTKITMESLSKLILQPKLKTKFMVNLIDHGDEVNQIWRTQAKNVSESCYIADDDSKRHQINISFSDDIHNLISNSVNKFVYFSPKTFDLKISVLDGDMFVHREKIYRNCKIRAYSSNLDYAKSEELTLDVTIDAEHMSLIV